MSSSSPSVPSPVPAGTERAERIETGTREAMEAFAAELRQHVERAIAADRSLKAWRLRDGRSLSQKWHRLFARRGHGYGAVLAVADQLDERATRFPAAVVSSSPAPPEGGRARNHIVHCPECGYMWSDYHEQVHPTPSPASPAETREGRERLAEAVATHLEATAEPWSYADGVARDATIRAATRAWLFIREWVDPASPAVSPHAGSKPDNPPSVLDQFQRMLDQMAFKHPTGEWFVSRTVVQGEIDRARQQGPEDDWPDAATPTAPSLPGEAEERRDA